MFAKLEAWTGFLGSNGQRPSSASIPLPAAAGNGRVGEGFDRVIGVTEAVKVVADAGDVPDENPG